MDQPSTFVSGGIDYPKTLSVLFWHQTSTIYFFFLVENYYHPRYEKGQKPFHNQIDTIPRGHHIGVPQFPLDMPSSTKNHKLYLYLQTTLSKYTPTERRYIQDLVECHFQTNPLILHVLYPPYHPAGTLLQCHRWGLPPGILENNCTRNRNTTVHCHLDGRVSGCRLYWLWLPPLIIHTAEQLLGDIELYYWQHSWISEIIKPLLIPYMGPEYMDYTQVL